MSNKISHNFFFNLLLTLSTYVINLVIFPYISRVLGLEMIGKTGFAANVVSYFSLFAVLGVSVVGVREISACRDDRQKRSEVFSSILGTLLLTTVTVTVAYLLLVCFVPRFQADRQLLLIGTATLFFTSLLIEWFYQGVEEFRYITIRSVAVKLAYAAAVIIFVKSEDDYLLYFILTVVTVVVNALINLLYSRNFAQFRLAYVSLRKFAKPIFTVGLYGIMTSMYTTFNVVFLGFLHPDTVVGNYYAATKIYYIILGVLSAFTMVMLPRMSALLSENKTEEFKGNIAMSFDLVFSFALPLLAGGLVLAPEIIRILSGLGYEGAVTPMRVIMPAMLVTSCAQIWVNQVLMPMRHDRILLVCAVIGAVVGISVNVLLVPSFGAVGSAIAVLAAEVVVNSTSLVYAIRKGVLVFPFRRLGYNVLLSIPYFIICILCQLFIASPAVTLVASVIACLIYFVLIHKTLLGDSSVGRFVAKLI